MRTLNRLRLVMHLIALLAVIGGAQARTVNAQVDDTTEKDDRCLRRSCGGWQSIQTIWRLE
jgi:hypothetical protein